MKTSTEKWSERGALEQMCTENVARKDTYDL